MPISSNLRRSSRIRHAASKRLLVCLDDTSDEEGLGNHDSDYQNNIEESSTNQQESEPGSDVESQDEEAGNEPAEPVSPTKRYRRTRKHDFDYEKASTRAAQIGNAVLLEDQGPMRTGDPAFSINDLQGLIDEDFDEENLYDGNIRSANEWRTLLNGIDETIFNRKEYAPGTLKAINAVEKRWYTFCISVLKKTDPATFFDGVTLKILYIFLDWVLSQKRDSVTGKLLRGMKKKQSLVTFWCCWRLAFERATGEKIDKFVDCRKIENVTAALVKHHKLSHETRENRPMTLDDLKLQLYTTLSTTSKTFRVGEQRILTVLFLLLLAPAGSRPESILQLRYGDIELALRRDPADPINGPFRLIIRLDLKFTKRYLGPKATKTFHIPEIIEEPHFLLSPHAFLLGILFHQRAFRSEALNDNPLILENTKIHEGEPELLILLRSDLADVPIFRKATHGTYGYAMVNEPLAYTTISKWVKRIGEIIGYENNTICYSLRYMAGNSLDQSVSVSDSLRNLILDHTPQSDTFQKHYLSRHVCVDLWATHRGLVPQAELLQQSTSHGASRSSRRPISLTTDQVKSLQSHPRILQLEKQLEMTGSRSQEGHTLRNKINAEKKRLQYRLLKQARKQWTEDQAVEDIDRQARGLAVEVNSVAGSSAGESPNFLHPLHENLVKALTTSLICDLATQRRRRSAAIKAIVAYCEYEEPVVLGMMKARQPAPLQELGEVDPKTALLQSVFVKDPGAGQRLRRCFICVGRALRLPVGDDRATTLCRTFARFYDCVRHFRVHHLANFGDDDKTWCPVCPGVVLEHKNHLRRHAEDVHGIMTWSMRS